ncbi:MAG: alkyl hydroperoxide reductase, partial [Alphaproteobacteria bacterium]|nr:alkyl hydroperoxide reductase [Alphaproteobacteria bacterium]
SDDYRNMPARLRMTAIANPGVERVDFELMCLGVSAINGCGMCLESHAHEVLTKGQTRDAVQEALRIAAIVQSLAVALEAAQVAQTTIAAAA